MAELSFFVKCTNDSLAIKLCLDSVINFGSRNIDYEIIVINFARSENVLSALSQKESRYPENIMIVNCDEEYANQDVMDIALQYASGSCFLTVDADKALTEKDFDNLLYDANLIDEDTFKFLRDKYIYVFQSQGNSQFEYTPENQHCCLTDYKESAGSVDMHYFFQDIYVAKKVCTDGVKEIYDIGSRIDGYISHLLSMDIKVTMIDVRPLPYEIDNMSFIQGNATDLNQIASGSIPNMSSLHALEHFGLGRYGDPVDYDGWKKALSEFSRIIADGGKLYLSVPVGNKEIVRFNGCRIFAPLTIIEYLKEKMVLQEFTFLSNGKRVTYDFSHAANYDEGIRKVLEDTRQYMLGAYDCGIFVFRKGANL